MKNIFGYLKHWKYWFLSPCTFCDGRHGRFFCRARTENEKFLDKIFLGSEYEKRK